MKQLLGQIGRSLKIPLTGHALALRIATLGLALAGNLTAANSPPTISDIANQTKVEKIYNRYSDPISVAFTVGDAQTSPGSLTVSATSSNPELVGVSHLVFGGSGANRTLTINSAQDKIGSATITVIVSDGQLTASDSFTLQVNPSVWHPPIVTSIPNQTICRNTSTGPLPFRIYDRETPIQLLQVSSYNSAPALIQSIVLGGSGAARTVTVTPVANATGTATITVSVYDDSGSDWNRNDITFTVTVTDDPAAAEFVGVDATTRGNWVGKYGGQGYKIWGDNASHPSAQISISPNLPYDWPESPAAGGLQRASNPAQTLQYCVHSPDFAVNDSFTVDINFTDCNEHQLAFYCLDYDAAYGASPRVQRIDVLKASNGSVLSTHTLNEFKYGKYVIWKVRGHVQVRFTFLSGSYNAVLSGLFVDEAPKELVWVDDNNNLPAGAQFFADSDSWDWQSWLSFPFLYPWILSAPPFSGQYVHLTSYSGGVQQHYFTDATDTLKIEPDDILFAHVYVDQNQRPSELMLQWLSTDGSWWHHRAFWGQDIINWWGPRVNIGEVPPAPGTWPEWRRLEVPAWKVGLVGRTVNGMAFTLYNGQVAWDKAGKVRAPASSDTDRDGLPDGWELANFGNLAQGTYSDPDADGLLNYLELRWNANPNALDSDGDSLNDGDEVTYVNTDPSLSDSEGDGLSDSEEIFTYGTDPLNLDTDGDGWSDGWEVIYQTDPLNPNSHP